MLNQTHIVQSIEKGNHRVLVERLMSNGRCHSRLARHVLLSSENVEVAALGLGLQRISELSYWAVPEGIELAHRLMRAQCRDGFFASGTESSAVGAQARIAASAIAVKALIDWRDQFQHEEAEQALLTACIDRALHAIARACGAINVLDTTALSIVLWQLGDCEVASLRLQMKSIRQTIAHAAPDFLRDELPRLALTKAA